MWALEHFWLAGEYDEAAGNTATITQPAPAIAATGIVRIVGSATVEQPAPSIAATGTNGAEVPVVIPGGDGRVRPRWPIRAPFVPVDAPDPMAERPRQRIVGVCAVAQAAPTIAATGQVGPSLEERWLLGLISDEEFLLGGDIRDPEELWALGVISDSELLLRSA